MYKNIFTIFTFGLFLSFNSFIHADSEKIESDEKLLSLIILQ